MAYYKYSYKLYNNQFRPRRYLMDVEAASPEQAIKKAGFDHVRDSGGKIEKSRRGVGYTNARINIYLPETIGAGPGLPPDFVMERILSWQTAQ